ncbi:MAG TPA: DNA polymerase III subunit chi [Chlamydiales bacterium]|nr:DNA polymerase III subunit chi [Chlamydiales bacterium]
MSHESRIIFFQVTDVPTKLKRILETVKAHFKKKESLLFFVEDDRALHYLDELLWKVPDTSFLPHAIANASTEEKIVITKTKTNVNHSPFAFNLCSTPLLIPGFKVIYDFEDCSAPNKKNLSELRFNAYKQAKILIECH